MRCAGVVAAVTISRSAFPNRLEHLVVLERFRNLWPKGDHNTVLKDMSIDPEERTYKATDMLLTIALKDMEFERQKLRFRAFVMGKTRAYFRAGALEFLEGERLKYMNNFATVLQTQVRTYLWSKRYKRFLLATVKLQSGYRRCSRQRPRSTSTSATAGRRCASHAARATPRLSRSWSLRTPTWTRPPMRAPRRCTSLARRATTRTSQTPSSPCA